MVPFIRYRVSGLPFAFRVSFPWMLDTDWSSAVSWQVPKMRVQMSKMQRWQQIALGGVLWITSGKAWPKALSGLIQTLFLNSRVLTWWKLGGWGKKALGETHWNNRIINLTPYTSIPSLIFRFFVMGCRCGSMCAKIWKNTPHSQNAIVELQNLIRLKVINFNYSYY